MPEEDGCYSFCSGSSGTGSFFFRGARFRFGFSGASSATVSSAVALVSVAGSVSVPLVPESASVKGGATSAGNGAGPAAVSSAATAFGFLGALGFLGFFFGASSCCSGVSGRAVSSGTTMGCCSSSEGTDASDASKTSEPVSATETGFGVRFRLLRRFFLTASAGDSVSLSSAEGADSRDSS